MKALQEQIDNNFEEFLADPDEWLAFRKLNKVRLAKGCDVSRATVSNWQARNSWPYLLRYYLWIISGAAW